MGFAERFPRWSSGILGLDHACPNCGHHRLGSRLSLHRSGTRNDMGGLLGWTRFSQDLPYDAVHQ